MSALLLKNIRLLATMDKSRREIPDAAVYVRDRVIEAVGMIDDMPVANALIA